MAIVNISVDTKAKTISATVNGQSIDNVQSVSAYMYESYDDEMKVDCSLSVYEEASEGVRKCTSYYANGGKSAIGVSHDPSIKPVDDFVGVHIIEVSGIDKDFEKYWTEKLQS